MTKIILKKFWNDYASTFHVFSCVILCIFMAGMYWSKWQAQGAELDTHEMRISKLEYQSAKVIQKLDDIMFFLHVPERTSK